VKDGKYSEKFSPKIDSVVRFWYVAIILSEPPSNVPLHLRESDQKQREYRTRTRLIKNKNDQQKKTIVICLDLIIARIRAVHVHRI
jgi:hypothetical protein